MNRITLLAFVGIIGIALLSCGEPKQPASNNAANVFDKGDKITNNNFKGDVWLKNLVVADSSNPNAVGSVTFSPGARTNWHSHPAGQIILAIDGVGYYQEKGSPKKIIKKGEAIKCPPNIAHWHGASADSPFVQVAITGREKGETVWLEPVSDDEYNH
ncbi:cupin domain-containing protein [Chitinophaga skermanii]|nr:cupin domain-containing protein [Chitinophaga skermanii]